MADDNEHASDIEERDRNAALAGHAQLMAKIKPSDECKHCGEELLPVRKPWGSCIECATKAEKIAKGFRR